MSAGVSTAVAGAGADRQSSWRANGSRERAPSRHCERKRSNPSCHGKNGLLRSARNDEEEIGVDRRAKSRVEGRPGVADVRSTESPPRHGERSGDTNARPSVMASQLVARMRALPVIASQLVARTRALPSLRAKAKQSILPWKECIASSLSLPCANASRLSQAMTAETLVRSCKTSLQ